MRLRFGTDFKLSEKKFKIINLYVKALAGKVDNTYNQTGSFSREVETVRIKLKC